MITVNEEIEKFERFLQTYRHKGIERHHIASILDRFGYVNKQKMVILIEKLIDSFIDEYRDMMNYYFENLRFMDCTICRKKIEALTRLKITIRKIHW